MLMVCVDSIRRNAIVSVSAVPFGTEARWNRGSSESSGQRYYRCFLCI